MFSLLNQPTMLLVAFYHFMSLTYSNKCLITVRWLSAKNINMRAKFKEAFPSGVDSHVFFLPRFLFLMISGYI